MVRLITSLGNRLKQEPKQPGSQPPRRLSDLLPFGEPTPDDRLYEAGPLSYSLTVFVTVAVYLIAGFVGMQLMAEHRVADGWLIGFVLTGGALVMLAAAAVDAKRRWMRLATRWLAWLAVVVFTGGLLGNMARVYLHSTSSRLSDVALYALLQGIGLGVVGLLLPRRSNSMHWLVLLAVGAVTFALALVFARNVDLTSVAHGVVLGGCSTGFCTDIRDAIKAPWSLRRAIDLGYVLPLYVLVAAILVA